MSSDERNPLERIFKRFNRALEKKPILNKVSKSLLQDFVGEIPADKANLTRALMNLIANDHLSLPTDPDSFIDTATSALDLFLTSANRPDLAGAARLSARAIRFINKKLKLDKCGEDTKGNPPSGPPITQKNGRHVIVYYLEEDERKLPKLPNIKGTDSTGPPRWARSQLKPAFDLWEGELKLDVVATEKRDQANLIITGRVFGPEVAPFGGDDVLALTDVGPPNGRQLAMVFDLAEDDLSMAKFRITAAHEFGHALGVKHAYVDKVGDLMSPRLEDLSPFPTDDDLAAAVQYGGWVRS